MGSKGYSGSENLPAERAGSNNLPAERAGSNNLPAERAGSNNLPAEKTSRSSSRAAASSRQKPTAIKPSHIRVAQHTIELSDRNLRPYTGQDLGVKLADGRVVPIDVGADPKRAIVGYLGENLRVLDRTYWSNLEIVEL